jgi:hypothetical protein
MRFETVFHSATRILLPSVLLPTLALGQQVTLGPSLSQILQSGPGIARTCGQNEYGTGLGVRLSVPVLSRWTKLQVAGRGHWLKRGAECAFADVPPPDGTRVEEDRINLLSQSFVATDLRLAARIPDIPLSFALGGGNAWHKGPNLPYLVLAAEIALYEQDALQFGLGAEYQYLRTTSDQVRRTYLTGQLVLEEPLGRVHDWSHAFALNLYLDVPFAMMRGSW